MMDIKAILDAVQEVEPKQATKKILAVRRLLSKDIIFSVLNENARLILERSLNWLQTITPSAHVICAMFLIMVHRVQMAGIDINNQQDAIVKIYEQNQRLYTGIEITQISWMRRVIKQKKCYSSLIIEAASPSIANIIIRSELIVESKLKKCKRYKSEVRLTQCF